MNSISCFISKSCNPFGSSLGNPSALIVVGLSCLDINSLRGTPLPVVLPGSWLHPVFSFSIFFLFRKKWTLGNISSLGDLSFSFSFSLYSSRYLHLPLYLYTHTCLRMYICVGMYLWLPAFCFCKFRDPRVVLSLWTAKGLFSPDLWFLGIIVSSKLRRPLICFFPIGSMWTPDPVFFSSYNFEEWFLFSSLQFAKVGLASCLSYFNGPTLKLYEIMGKRTTPEFDLCFRIESLCSTRSIIWNLWLKLLPFFYLWDSICVQLSNPLRPKCLDFLDFL